MQVTCAHCSHAFEHEAPAYARSSATAVCPACGRDTPATGGGTSDWLGSSGGLGGSSGAGAGGGAAEASVYCFNCGKAMAPRDGELIPVCDDCRDSKGDSAPAGDAVADPDEPVADWMIRKANNNVYGPFPSETIVEWIKAKKIMADEEVAHIGGAWRLFSQHEEFGKYFDKPGGTKTVARNDAVDFRHRNPVKEATRGAVRIVAALLILAAGGAAVWYAVTNKALVVSESAVDGVVRKVNKLTENEKGTTNPLAEDAGKLLFSLAEKHGTPEAPSMEHLLRGRTFLLRDNLPNYQKARVELEKAVVADEGNALALAALAELYNQLAYYGYGTLDLQRQSIYLLEMAEAADTYPAEVMRARAAFLVYSGNTSEGKAKIRDALQQNPSDPELHFLSGISNLDRDGGQTEASRKDFEKALELDPDFHQVWYELARGEEEAGRLKEAIAHYKKKLALDPASALSHTRLGAIYEEVGDRPSAIRHYDSAVSIQPDQQRALLRRAVLAYQVEGAPDRAVSLLRPLWKGERGGDLRIQERKEVGAHLAGALRLAGQPDEAIAVADELLKEDRVFGPALFHKGLALLDKKQTDEALPVLNRTDDADLAPRERAAAKFEVGRAAHRAERPLDAQDAFRRAIELDGTFIPAHLWAMAVSLVVAPPEQAAKDLMDHLESDPLAYRRAHRLSPVFEPIPSPAKIAAQLQALADAQSFSPNLHAATGIAWFHSGDEGAAKAELKKAVSEDGQHLAARFYLGLIEYEAGRWAAADKAFADVLSSAHNQPIFLAYRADVLRRLDRVEESIALYEKAFGYGLESSWALSGFGEALASQGDTEGAKEKLDRAVALGDGALEPRASLFRLDL